MAETTSALCYPTPIHFPKEPIPAPSTSFTSRRFSSQFQRPPSPSLRFTLKASGSAHFPGDDDFGFYPWENPNATESSVQWVSEERVTLFTSDGLIQIGGNIVQRRVTPSDVVAAEKATREGLHEKLTMTVAVPLLWGVPPASETLHIAVRSGGGIVDKVYRQWDFL